MSQPESQQHRSSRRSFLTAILAACAATVVGCRRSNAQPVALLTLYGDGVHDDTAALQAMLDGEQVEMPHNGIPGTPEGRRTYLISDTINVPSHRKVIDDLSLVAHRRVMGEKPFLNIGRKHSGVHISRLSVALI